MRTVEPAARGRGDLFTVGQVDGDAIGVEQVRDALDHRLEGVRERELRDRLAEDREQRATALELEPGIVGQLRRPQHMGGADGEARELLDSVPARRSSGREPNLEHAEDRSAELERHQLCRRGRAGNRRAGLLDDGVRRQGELVVDHDRPVGAGHLERLSAQAPHDRRIASGGDGREPGDTRRGAVLGREHGQGVARDIEHAVAARALR